jgi:hypothetical protein
MPAFLTHWHVLIETARRSQDVGSNLGSLIIDNEVLKRRLQSLSLQSQIAPVGAVWDTGPLPEINIRYPGSDISAMAYLGALAPDITNYQKWRFYEKISGIDKQRRTKLQTASDKSTPWALLFHTNRSGDLLIALLEQIAHVPSPALRSQALAFAMGYISHIATDIALNPWINVLAGTYSRNEIGGLFAPLSRHFYVELCLDEYIATTYFAHQLYGWSNQPWIGYVEPAARDLTISTKISARTLDLFINAAEITYGLTSKQNSLLRSDMLAGVQRLRLYLAGRGLFRWLTLSSYLRNCHNDPIVTTIATKQRKAGVTTSEEVLEYAIRLSARLCKLAMDYYIALRQSSATANERKQLRAALRNDLRNWDLQTGYNIDVLFDQEITLSFLHNWLYFTELWNTETVI